MSDMECWITLRFKGSIDTEADPDQVAQNLLIYLENQVRMGNQDHGFMVEQNGDVMEVETEDQIYETEGQLE
ncbi:hypothetical protein FHV99_004627 [Ochrobactrum sp. P20RRXII]|nr:hypothetical protein [Ochrobactrum sp. P20RRXII]NIH77375.1 hypothetical protein [Ochrobactrum sp. P20RRXII]